MDELRRRYLLKVYELSGGDLRKDIYQKEPEEELGFSDEEAKITKTYLFKKGMIEGSMVNHFRITTGGLDEAERIMKATFVENERRVLQKLYVERDRRNTSPHEPKELANELNIDIREVYDILAELEKQDLISGVDQAVWIIPAGIKLIESGGQPAGAAVPNISFTTNVHGPMYGGVQQGVHGNTQNISNQIGSFDEAANKLLSLIENSDLTTANKIIVAGDVQTLIQLNKLEKTPEVKEAAKLKLSSLDKALSLSADLYTLAVPLLPIFLAPFK